MKNGIIKFMETIIRKVDKHNIDMQIMQEAGEILKKGGLVAFPTETVYGLGANALDEEAAKKTYAAKGRPSDNPLIVHIATLEDLEKVAKNISKDVEALANRFWPGPLTMIFEKTDIVPYGTTGGLDTVAVRMPSDPIARELILAGGGFVSAPSANTSGRPSPTTAEHVSEDLSGKIDMIIDGGSVDIGLESTILDMTVNPPMILRPGAITAEMFEEVIDHVTIDETILGIETKKAPKAPGMKYKHYAPKTKCVLVYSNDKAKMINKINEISNDYKNVVVLGTQGNMPKYISKNKLSMGATLEDVAQNIFSLLRKADKCNEDLVIIEGVTKQGLGLAIINRLIRACEYNYIEI